MLYEEIKGLDMTIEELSEKLDKDLEVPEPDSKIVSLFFQIQRLDKNKKKFALSMVESMLDNLAGL